MDIDAGQGVRPVHPRRDELCVSVIVTHFNYSDCIEDALVSALAQTHTNLEVLVVDDASEDHHRGRLSDIAARLDDPRLRIILADENAGQIRSIFRGLDEASGEFVTLLDPDDRYEPEFLESLLRAHLNPVVIAAVAGCEMGFLALRPDGTSGHVLTRDITVQMSHAVRDGTAAERDLSLAANGFSVYVPPWISGWHWASTSSLMFRRDALEAIRPPPGPMVIRNSADAYCAQGAHIIGGTLFVDRLLSWRGIHDHNVSRHPLTVSQNQRPVKSTYVETGYPAKKMVIDAFFRGEHHRLFSTAALGEMLTAHFPAEDVAELAAGNAVIRDCLIRYAVNAD